MNPQIKKLWVAALRDGSFVKGFYQMRDLNDHYDATGVLCELAVIEQIIDPPKRIDAEESIYKGYVYGPEKLAVGLPKAVEEWAGISYSYAWRIALKGDEGMSFIKLADWIEENL